MLRVTTRYGAILDLSPHSYIDGIVIREGYYESEVLEALVANLSGGGVLWDIGANFGLHGLTAKKLAPSTEVVCFEPAFEVLGRLWRNRALNGLEVQVVAAALSDHTGFQTLYLGPAGNSGMSTLSPWSEADYSGKIEIATICGDDAIACGRLPSPTVIKLDVEGHELPVLQGMANALRAPGMRAVVFEDGVSEDTPVKALLKASGFIVSRLKRREATAHGLDNFLAERPAGFRG
jgi:FkbM family methyltransferase